MRRGLLLPLIFLAACATAPAPQATLTPDVYQQTLGNIQAQATLEAMQAASQALAANLTLTAYAPTRLAAETATERAWIRSGWTATASAQQTITAGEATSTAQAWTPTPNFTATVAAAQAEAQATALHGEAVSVELAVERERMMNSVQAVAPWAALLIAFTFALTLAWRWSKIRPIARDARGDAPLLVLNGASTTPTATRRPSPISRAASPPSRP